MFLWPNNNKDNKHNKNKMTKHQKQQQQPTNQPTNHNNNNQQQPKQKQTTTKQQPWDPDFKQTKKTKKNQQQGQQHPNPTPFAAERTVFAKFETWMVWLYDLHTQKNYRNIGSFKETWFKIMIYIHFDGLTLQSTCVSWFFCFI